MSMDILLKATTQFEEVPCCVCDVRFAMPEDYVARLRRKKIGFCCPNGHSLLYHGKSDSQKIKDLNAKLTTTRAQAESRVQRAEAATAHQVRRVAAAKGKVTRLKNDFAKGKCPCCNKHFKVLKKHMARMHPEYENGEADDLA